jgi:hypothetical protein
MSQVKCRAANPATCRFHGKSIYAETTRAIEQWTERLPKQTSFEGVEAVHKVIKRYELVRDASAVGFAKLAKELQRSLKNQDVSVQADLVARINAATDSRMKDGKVHPWSAVLNDSKAYANKIVADYPATEGELHVPYSLTGTHSVGAVASRLAMTTITSPGFTPGRVRVSSPAPVIDDRDLTDDDVVAQNIAEDRKTARADQTKRFSLLAAFRR